MTTKPLSWQNNKILLVLLLGTNIFSYLDRDSVALSQVIEDGTLPTQVETQNNKDFVIDAGQQTNNNLFHSFTEFSIPNNGSVSFNNQLSIQNIISRVTGSSISNINGLIQTNGTANLFLINPNGIIFGENARLNVGGSFIGTTAEALVFDDGSEFSTNLNSSEPLLTVDVPLGLQFGSNPGEIVNRANFSTPNRFDPSGRDRIKLGLTILPDRTLTLLGGDITFDGGAIASAGGNIELGSVAENSFINLEAFGEGFKVNYDGVNRFQDIQLNNLAFVDASGEGAGEVNIRGKNIRVFNGSGIISNTGDVDGGAIKIEASDTVEVNGSDRTGTKIDLLLANVEIFLPFASQIASNTLGAGKAGNIEILAKNLNITNGGSVELLTFPGSTGKGGDLYINTTENVYLTGARPLLGIGENAEEIIKETTPSLSIEESIGFNRASGITNVSLSDSTGGNIYIAGNRIRLEDGTGIGTSPFRSGDSGNIDILAEESIEIVGTSINNNVGSAIASNTFSQGNAGDIHLETDRLSILDGGIVVSSTSIVGGGDAGNITIDSRLTQIDGVSVESQKPSLLSSATDNESIGGNIIVNTDSLVVSDRGTISIRGTSSGSPGNLQINANSVLLSDRGLIAAENAAAFDGGNVELNIGDRLTLQENSLISAQAFNNANGGNIDIEADFIIANPNENNDILANAVRGNGGNITILSNGIFGIEEGQSQPLNSSNDIDASSEFGMAGTITFNFPEATSNFEEKQSVDVIDVRALLNNNFCKVSLGSKYYSIGKGGIGISPDRDLNISEGWTDFRFNETAVATEKTQSQSLKPEPSVRKLEPVRGWYKDSQGRMVLTAKPLVATLDSSSLPHPDCNTKTKQNQS